MDEYESLSHSKWECKYHVIFIPKCRRKTLYKELRQHLGEVFRRLAEPEQSRIEEGHLMAHHVHDDLDSAQVRGVRGGGLHQGQKCDSPCAGLWRAQAEFCWSTLLGAGYMVSTVGRDETVIREYIRNQEQEDKRLDQLNLWK